MSPELRRALAAGDVDAVVRLYEPLCRWTARRYFIHEGGFDDLVQEARIGVAEAARDWRPEMGASFNTFAALCAYRKVVTAVKHATRLKFRALNEAVSLDEPSREMQRGGVGQPLREALAAGPDACDAVLLREQFAEVMAAIGTLTPMERTALIGVVFEGRDYAEVAVELGGEKSVDNALQRMRRKMRAVA